MRMLILSYNMDSSITAHVYGQYIFIMHSCTYNANSVMYHEPRYELYILHWLYYHNRTKQYMNGTLKANYFGDLCCKISINVSTCNINMSILATCSIHINKYLVVHECLQFQFKYSYIFLNPGTWNIFKKISPTNYVFQLT